MLESGITTDSSAACVPLFDTKGPVGSDESTEVEADVNAASEPEGWRAMHWAPARTHNWHGRCRSH